MTWEEALDAVVARTGHLRYARLCSDENPDPESRRGYRRLMVEMASGTATPAAREARVVAGDVVRRAATRPAGAGGFDFAAYKAKADAARACPFSSRDSGCGCSGIKCALKTSWPRVVSLQDCIACVETYGA